MTAETLTVDEPLVFSEIQQQAVLGHAIYRNDIFDTLENLKVDGSWFANQSLADLWGHIKKFRKDFNKSPISWEELVESIKDETIIKTAASKTAQKCEKAVNQHQWEVLEQKLLGWAKDKLIFFKTKEIVEAYNNGKTDRANSILHACSHELLKTEGLLGIKHNSFMPSNVRVRGVKDAMLAERDKILPFGISFFADALGGILPSDLILLGADSGAGKTEAAKILAVHVAKTKDVPVHFFALEAEDNEIEMRIQYGLMGDMYRADHPNVPNGMICYRNYRFGSLANEFAPYEARAQEIFDKDYKNLHVIYGHDNPGGGFGPQDLEKAIYRIKDDTSLIILDHLHYVDLEGKDENREMAALVKRIRDMNQTLKIPFILVCHIKKADKKFGELVPDKEQYHGTSNIIKISTLGLMLSRATGFVSADYRTFGTPTFLRVTKSRIDGSAMNNVGVGFFDFYKNEYSNHYCCGHLSRKGDKWFPNTDSMPMWAKEENLVRNCSEVE